MAMCSVIVYLSFFVEPGMGWGHNARVMKNGLAWCQVCHQSRQPLVFIPQLPQLPQPTDAPPAEC